MQSKIINFLFIVAVMLPLCYSSWGLTESSEARYAEISREMYNNGDYINPKLLGINHYHKPPLTYYITALGFYFFGVNEYGVRFFPALAFLFQLLLVFKITMLLFDDKRLSLSATLIYFSYPLAHAAAMNLTTDCFLSTFIFAAIFFYLKYRQAQTGNGFIYLFYVFCGLAFLTKGPVGLLPSCVFAVLYNAFSKTKKSAGIHHFIALITCIVMCTSWFLFLLRDNPTLFSYFINHQLIDRVSRNSFDRTKPFWYYLAFMPLAGLPTILLLLDYFRENILKRHFPNPINLVLIASFLVCLVVFSASASKLVLYILPLYLFAAIVSAWHLSVMPEKRLLLFRNIFFYFNTLLLLLLPASVLLPIPFKIPGVTLSICCSTGVAVLFLCRYHKRIPPYLSTELVAAAGMAVIAFIAPFIMKANELEINSVKPLANFINSHTKDSSRGIIIYDQFLPSLAFYTGKKLVTLYNGNEKAIRETQFEKNDFYWKGTYFRLPRDLKKNEFLQLQQANNSFLVAKINNPLPESFFFLIKNLSKKIVIGKWVIYYE